MYFSLVSWNVLSWAFVLPCLVICWTNPKCSFDDVTCCLQLYVAFFCREGKGSTESVSSRWFFTWDSKSKTGVLDTCLTISVLSSVSKRNLWPFPPHLLPLPHSAYIQHNREPCPRAAYVRITWPLDSSCRDTKLQNSLYSVESELPFVIW